MNNSLCLSSRNPASVGTAGRHGDSPALWLRRIFDLVLRWQTRSMERTHLAELDDRLLRDIGLSRADVELEASKPFWRA